jgi:hypothetical protein
VRRKQGKEHPEEQLETTESWFPMLHFKQTAELNSPHKQQHKKMKLPEFACGILNSAVPKIPPMLLSKPLQ